MEILLMPTPRNAALITLAAASLWAADPRTVDGLEMRHTAYLAMPPVTLTTGSSPEVPMLTAMVYEEARLWANASDTLRHKDLAAHCDFTASWLAWQAQARRQLDDQKLATLMWLEHRWQDRHAYYQGERSAAYARWRAWTSMAIRSLQQTIQIEDADLRPYAKARLQAERQASAPEEHGLAYLQGILAYENAQKQAREERAARENDPLYNVKHAVTTQQEQILGAVQAIVRANK
jgi:hypothetical protein